MPDDRLLRRTWDGECIVYDKASGDTHLLDSFAAEVLFSLTNAPAGISELESRLRSHCGKEAADDLAIYIRRLLSKLSKLGLVTQLRS